MRSDMSAVERGLLTMAFGDQRYINMAANLARSVRRNWPDQSLAIVTDAPASKDLALFDEVIPMRPELGSGLSQKLNLDRYSPFAQTLFLDSDCLVVRDMSFAWDLFAGERFSVVGGSVTSGSWFGADLAQVIRDLGLPQGLPKFNGGLMYWDTTVDGAAIFQRARDIMPKYAELGFTAFRSSLPEADEPLISIAMALEGLHPVKDSGSTMATPLGLSGPFLVDVLRGKCSFIKSGVRVSPAAPHFCGPFAEGPHYRREALKLRWQPRAPFTWAINLGYAPMIAVRYGHVGDLARRVKRRFSRPRALADS